MTKQYVLHKGTYTTYEGEVTLPKVLPAGAYTGQVSMAGIHFSQHKFVNDHLIALPSGPAGQVQRIIRTFMDKGTQEKYAKAGLTYKRGVLMHGPPGSGKTVANRMIVDTATAEHEAITLVNPDPRQLRTLVSTIRDTEGEARRLMVLWEEFEKTASRHEGELLDLMDGVSQMENILFLATTNHLESIPTRFTERPSRFADVVYVGLPTADIRRTYIMEKAKMMGFVLDTETTVQATDGMSLDQVKNYMIFIALLGLTPEDAVTRLMGHGASKGGETAVAVDSFRSITERIQSMDRDALNKLYSAWYKRDEELTEEEADDAE